MKILDKLKNALFEEEYVEIEEKPVKQKKEKVKVKAKKDVSAIKDEKRLRNVRITNFESEEKKQVEEEPIAKKILPVKEEREESVVREEVPVKEEKEDFQFPSIEDEEFRSGEVNNVKVTEIENEVPQAMYQEPVYHDEVYQEVDYHNDEDVKLYQTSKEDEYIKQYTSNEYGNYEKTKEKKVFKPSPNISPIFGIIDDSKVSDRPQPKKEVRLTSAVRNEKLDVDEVRRKAYGIRGAQEEAVSSIDDGDDDYDNMLVDLTDDSLPEVNKVTVGDAEEYFEDLGLEYDTDYIDAKKAKASGRRLKSEAEYESSKTVVDDAPVKVNSTNDTVNNDIPDFLKEQSYEQDDNESDEDNLFDLIDSMYDK